MDSGHDCDYIVKEIILMQWGKGWLWGPLERNDIQGTIIYTMMFFQTDVESLQVVFKFYLNLTFYLNAAIIPDYPQIKTTIYDRSKNDYYLS